MSFKYPLWIIVNAYNYPQAVCENAEDANKQIAACASKAALNQSSDTFRFILLNSPEK